MAGTNEKLDSIKQELEGISAILSSGGRDGPSVSSPTSALSTAFAYSSSGDSFIA